MTVHRRELKSAPYNPRKISKPNEKRLRKGIEQHGFVGGIIWNKRSGNIVSGHQRIAQLDELEGTDDYLLDVDVIDVTDPEEREINVILNNAAVQGEFDEDKLAVVIDFLKDNNRSVERTGFSMADIQLMLGDDYLQGEFADQRDAEANALEMLAKVREDGKQAEEEFFDVEDGENISTTVPTAPPDKDASGAPVEPEYTSELKERREALRDENADAEEADFVVTFVFNNNRTLLRFLSKVGLDLQSRYFDQDHVEAAFDIDLRD
jgi:hypothetical protein